MANLQLAFLGAPEVHDNDRIVTLPTRKALALLVYLAVEGGVQPRDHLTALLWPESDALRGRAALRKTLGYLKQGVGRELAALTATRDALQLEPGPEIQVDVWQIAAATQALRQPPLATPEAVATLPTAYRQTLLKPLQQAIRQYRGDFLAGFSLGDALDFDDWASQQREIWHKQAIFLFDRFSQIQFEAGELAEALDTATRWLTHNPFSETPYRRLMQLHLARGDRHAAWQTFTTCQKMLADELGVEPAPETIALSQRIRANRVALSPRRPLALASDPTRPATGLPLVGRAFEHGQLVNSYRLAQTGPVQVITLEGEAGIGKTRLAEEFLGWAGAQGGVIWRGRAPSATEHLPYQPIIGALRPLLNQPGLNQLSPLWLSELSRILPELVEMRPELPPVTAAHNPDAHLRLLEAISRLGQTLARDSVLVLFIDDGQWADAASLEALAYLGRRWQEMGQSALLVLTLRQEELVQHWALLNWLTNLRRTLSVTRLSLGTLTLTDTQQLVQATTQELTAPLLNFASQLFQETKGHPFFLMQLLHSLLERSLLRRDEQMVWQAELDRELPGTVRELIQSRLVQLTPLAQSCCSAGAVLGDGFTLATLGQVADISEREALAAGEELLRRGLWREQIADDAAADLTYFFTHDYIREVAYLQLSLSRRRYLHRVALEALAGQAVPGQLAHHALSAGLVEPAFRYSLEAGAAALRIFAIQDALHHLTQAQRLWQSPTLSGQPQLADEALSLYDHLGRAYELNGQNKEAVEHYLAWLDLAQRQGNLMQEGLALNRLATSQAQTFTSLPAPLELLNQASQVAAASGSTRLQSETEWNLALLNYYNVQIPVALTHGQTGLALARQAEIPPLIARLLNTLAYVYGELGQWSEALACAEESQALFAQVGDQAMQVDSLVQLAQSHLALGQPHLAQAVVQTALAMAIDIHNPWSEVISRFQLALTCMESGDLETALYQAETSTALAQKHDLKLVLCLTQLVLGHVYRLRGELERAWDTHQQAYQFNEDISSQPFKAPIAAALCADAVHQKNWGNAYTWANIALATRPRSLQFHIDMTFWCEIAALLQAGEKERARQVVYRAEGMLGRRGRYQIAYLRALALLADADGNTPEAQSHLQTALNLATEMGLPLEIRSIRHNMNYGSPA